jgi:glycoprotein 3-alpha-L-fucosyltransferase
VELLQGYKFGFAMENSIWQDYVTEKLFQVYTSGAVPIVVGAPNSHDYEPLPGSIIYDKDFPSIEAMAKHILYLASNDTAYQEYLRWKHEGPSDEFKALIDISAVHSRCRLCIKMADRHVEKYGDFDHSIPMTSHKGEITFLIRERNTFYFRKLVLNENDLTIPSMYSRIFDAFHDRLPVWAIDRPASLNNNTWKIFRVYRYIGAAQTMYDTLFNDGILIDSDEKLRSLEHGSKLEVIFV